MKTNAIVRIVLFSLAIFFLLGVLGVGLGVTTYMVSFTEETGKTVVSSPGEVTVIPAPAVTETSACTADPARICEIEIEWAAGSITIEPSDSSTEILIRESEVAEKYRMECRQSGETLSIRYSKDSIAFPSFGASIPAKDLVITVPAGWICESLEIDAASANVIVCDMTIRKLDYNGASGACQLHRCVVDLLDLDTASGNVTFTGCLDSLDFDGASADCALVLSNCPSHIDLDGMSGSLDITLPSDCGFTVYTEGLSSDFSSDFATTLRSGAHCYGDGTCRMEIDALSGKVCVRDGGYAAHSSAEDCPDTSACSIHSSHHSGHH